MPGPVTLTRRPFPPNVLLALGRLVQEARDSWVIAIVELTVLAAYFVAGAPLWQALLAGVAVLATRVVVGLLRPVAGYTFDPLSVLPPREIAIATLVCRGLSDGQIAKRLGIPPRAVREAIPAVQAKLGLENREQLIAFVGRWLPDVGSVQHWYERSIVRGTLAAGGFMGLGWTSYQIVKTIVAVMNAP